MTSKRQKKIKRNITKDMKNHRRITEKIMGCDGNVIMLEYDSKYPPKVKVMCGE